MPSMMEDFLAWQQKNREKLGAKVGMSPEEVAQLTGAAEEASNYLPTGPLVGIGKGTLIRKLKQIFKENPEALEGSLETVGKMTKKGLKNIRALGRQNKIDPQIINTYGYSFPYKSGGTYLEPAVNEVVNEMKTKGLNLDEAINSVSTSQMERELLLQTLKSKKGVLKEGGVIALSETARPTTFAHELGHLMYRDLNNPNLFGPFGVPTYLTENVAQLQKSTLGTTEELIAETIGHSLTGNKEMNRIYKAYNQMGLEKELSKILDMVIESKYVDYMK